MNRISLSDLSMRVRALALGGKLACILFAQAWTLPQHMLGTLAVQFLVAWVDRLMCGVASDFDDNGVLLSILAARLLGLLRSGNPLPGSTLNHIPINCTVALLGVFCLHDSQGRQLRVRDQWFPASLLMICLLSISLTHADMEPLVMFGTRAACFLTLSVMLHARSPHPKALFGAWGFVIFVAVLVTRWEVAWTFASYAMWQLVALEWAQPPERCGAAYRPVPTEAVPGSHES